MQDTLEDKLKNALDTLDSGPVAKVYGRLVRLNGLTLEVTGCRLIMGQRCLVETAQDKPLAAEVIGFNREITYLMPLQNAAGLFSGARVTPLAGVEKITAGEQLLGRVLDGLLQPLDGKPVISGEQIPLFTSPNNPLSRTPITQAIDVGIRAINAMLTPGKGQRLGLFAGSGVGKSVLLGMMTQYTRADIVIVGLIGERGREVREFIEHSLGEQGLARAIVIAAPADATPLMRLRAAQVCHRLAEYYRDQGRHVLLLMDSLTRYAQAQREIGLATGEPPATKGYPPSVFSKLPQLVERAGNGGEGQGSITAFFTVLTEGDDLQDPIADAARAILDGHIVLSRDLADAGHYPAIDIEASISRVMPMVTSEEHQELARQLKQVYALYQQNKDLISIGAYSKGNDPRIDRAIDMLPVINFFLQQKMHDVIPYDQSLAQLQEVMPAAQAHAQNNQQAG